MKNRPRRNPYARKHTPATQLPHECVVLGVDTAQRSGWCIMLRGIYVASGEFDLLRGPDSTQVVCARALDLGVRNSLPVVLVYEKPFAGTSQGQYVGAWKMAWSAAGGVKTRFVGVMTSQWRARVLGGTWAFAKRDDARRKEREVALRISGKPLVGGDEAPAICIARWASHAGEVLKKLPASMRRVVA